MKLEINQECRISKKFTSEDVEMFSKLSLDFNPIHLDENYASKNIFKRKIVHGFLYTSLISAIIANELPGEGSIYKEQTLKFLKPVFHDDTVEAVVRVVEIYYEKKEVLLETRCYKDSELIVSGQAIIKNYNL